MASIDVETILDKLTIDEKITLLAGKSTWSTATVERLGIPEITVCAEQQD
jgi:beta-glucosidase